MTIQEIINVLGAYRSSGIFQNSSDLNLYPFSTYLDEDCIFRIDDGNESVEKIKVLVIYFYL
jgi:hypothetical protein